MPVSPARAAAFEVLMRIETTDAYASELLHSSRLAKLSPADRGLLTELVMGVLRWRGVLDHRIAEHLRSPADGVASRKIPALVAKDATSTPPQNAKTGCPGDPGTGHPTNLSSSNRSLAKLDLEVLTALRLGAYQILFLDRVPKHAAVNDSVELVKTMHRQSAAGLVNAVLRKVERVPADLDAREAHPEWLVERWVRLYGAEGTAKICNYDQVTPKFAFRVGKPRPSKGAKDGVPSSSDVVSGEEAVELRSTGQPGAAVPTWLVEELRAEKVELERGKLLSSAFTIKSGDVTATKAFRERRLFIQDEGSQLVALLVGEGRKILDCCAAPGGKTRILAERNPGAMVMAMDLHPQRAALLRKLVPAENVRVIAADVRRVPLVGSFDRVLVDAPCSGTGTLARNPEIKWRLKPEDLSRLQKYQLQILRAAMRHVSSGGRILYSTCSLEPEENEQVIEKTLAEQSSFRVVDCKDEIERLRASGEVIWGGDSLVRGPYLRTIPGVHPCDGFFAAILARE